MAKAHILMMAFPAQGHVTPLMELSHRLVDQGFEVTFVNTESQQMRVLSALPAGGTGTAAMLDGIHLASIPDGLANDEDRKDLSKLVHSLYKHMPGHLERLIAEMEAAGRPKVKWLISDVALGACSEVAEKLGVRLASFWSASAASLAIMLSVPKLVKEGLINEQGWAERDETFQVAPETPPLHTMRMPWMAEMGAPVVKNPALFQAWTRFFKLENLGDVVICNSFNEAEVATFKLYPDILPIGPLFADRELKKPVGHFLPEDESCIKWLDAQPDQSVVYVAFGSMAIFDSRQFEELAEGLELTGHPFLWVVRPDFTVGLSKAWLVEFQQRIVGKGIIVSWCSQQQVLAHPAVACFVSHCGWNSTMEGVRNGVSFLCWPYFCDQYLDQSYITDVWKTGVVVSPSADGIVTKEELRIKVEQVLGDRDIKERAQLFMDVSRRCIKESGSSCENFSKFVTLLCE